MICTTAPVAHHTGLPGVAQALAGSRLGWREPGGARAGPLEINGDAD
jgi:hypothetical protein